MLQVATELGAGVEVEVVAVVVAVVEAAVVGVGAGVEAGAEVVFEAAESGLVIARWTQLMPVHFALLSWVLVFQEMVQEQESAALVPAVQVSEVTEQV